MGHRYHRTVRAQSIANMFKVEQRTLCSRHVAAIHTREQPEATRDTHSLAIPLSRVEHNTHSRQVRRGEPISSLDLANTKRPLGGDRRPRRRPGCRRRTLGETLVVDEEGAEEGRVHLELSDLSLGQMERRWRLALMTVRLSAYLLKASAALTLSPICFLSIEHVPRLLTTFLGLTVVLDLFVGSFWRSSAGEDLRGLSFS